jgi:hypothetical protein
MPVQTGTQNSWKFLLVRLIDAVESTAAAAGRNLKTFYKAR